MKKIIIAAVSVVASLGVIGSASAGVDRCDALVPVKVNTTVTTATFTVNQPNDSITQWGNVWKHDFTVIVKDDNTFAGTSTVTDNGGSFAWAEDVTGSFNADRTLINFDTIPTGAATGGATFKVTDAPYNVSVPVESTWGANIIEFMISTPKITTDTTSTPGTESVKNHGQFVKAMGGGKVAAQACAGMPLNSTQGS